MNCHYLTGKPLLIIVGKITDTLALARKRHPGQKYSLFFQ
ncbi:hypothetical protein BGS_1098 [Beggiatoa sp. SS]|nr:hypothetical protein BGS_1098 [Beggiatoa sp. SS]